MAEFLCFLTYTVSFKLFKIQPFCHDFIKFSAMTQTWVPAATKKSTNHYTITASYQTLLVDGIHVGTVMCTSWLNAGVVGQFSFTQLLCFNSFKKGNFSVKLAYIYFMLLASSHHLPRLLLKTYWMRKIEVDPTINSPPMITLEYLERYC